MKISDISINSTHQNIGIQCFINGGGYFINVESPYGEYLVSEVADPFIVACILPALMTGEDIECEAISEDLYYRAPTIIFLLSKVFNRSIIKIIPKRIIKLEFNPKGVGTGFSGGIDSLCTFINHYSEKCPPSYRITHLTLFNIGSYGNEYELTARKFEEDAIRAQTFSESIGLPLVKVDSNIGGLFTHPEIRNYSLRSTLCLSVAILALSKLFRTYYISSTGTVDDMKLSRYDQYFYENSLTQLLSSRSTEILIAEADLDRVQKTRIVTGSPFGREYLYVCAADIYNERFNSGFNKDTAPNCSRCIKCVRTMLTIDFLGLREEFRGQFDFEKYDRDYKRHLLDIAAKKGYDHFSREIYELMKTKGIRIPHTILFRGWIKGQIKQLKYRLKNK